MQEGYRFLDEKRLVLAAEIVRELARYESLARDFSTAMATAREALAQAVARHGLEGLQVYPPLVRSDELKSVARSVLGVVLHDVALVVGKSEAVPALWVSPEAEHCRKIFAGLIPPAATLAGIAGNLQRLQREYRRTARRARALEDVLLPEIDGAVAGLDLLLEDLEREEAIRVHISAGRREGG